MDRSASGGPVVTGPQRFDTHWIGGRWTPAAGAGWIDVDDPATASVIATVPGGGAADATRAVEAAVAAYPGWACQLVDARIAAVAGVLDRIEAATEAYADQLTAEMGAPLRTARQVHLGLGLGIARGIVSAAREHAFESKVGNSLVVSEPAGVAACITPWNVPLLLTLQKVVAALVSGCTVVLKPSELTPLNARMLAETTAEAGIPPGVFNVVFGAGTEIGAALAAHPGVDVVSFTGSTGGGRAVARGAADTAKRVHLELGGKNASVVLAGADLETAVRATVAQACVNSGQACLQWSRLLVPRDRHDEATAIAADAVAAYRTGDPRDPATDLGPLISAKAAARVRGYVERGLEEGAELVAGGPGRPGGADRGYFVQPTVFGRVTPEMTIAREEIFGPVLAVMPYDSEDDAARIANDTPYGLHGAVWAEDDGHAVAFARSIRTGVVDINGGPYNVMAPFGGVKLSGTGRECGSYGLEAFLETKSLQLPSLGGRPGTAAGLSG